MMTTRLAGDDTTFLPFNMGHDRGTGNPPNPKGYRTSYLWERVWERDAWLDLLGRFVHVETPEGATKLGAKEQAVSIFPRFHQWDAVRALESAAKAGGPGENYLVQHSAGSGKSNSIAWLAHRLANLHDDADRKVFDKVVVITDRRILDRQLQETIYQFEHAHGVVVRIDRDSQQLAEALAGEQAKVIITTLQKFPFVLEHIEGLPGRSYAVIVDEAHSSQSGEAAKELRAVLGDTETETISSEDLLVARIAGRGKQPNLSFFAFTATPKAKTLQMFGRKAEGPDGEEVYEPFHLYSMKQAIEEGFIMDVLRSYTTYDTFYRIAKASTDDPKVDPAKAKAQIARYVTLHPENLAQRAEIVVEHFRTKTAPRINGNAKAMVVTSSREHAVRFKLALDKYLAEHGIDLGVLVAFSGTVTVNGDEYTESSMNGFPESQTARKFDTDQYRIMVVAEKFQTGFDQPLLHTMYVDKPLSGLAAVQTLSRLNRRHDAKRDTFVLDFRNDTDDIAKAFEPYYGKTMAIPTDPNEMGDARRALAAFGVIWESEIPPVVAALSSDASDAQAKVYAGLDSALERFGSLTAEQQDEFRDALKRYINVYSFMSQVVPYTDRQLEDWYVYSRALRSVLPHEAGQGTIDVSSKVELTHLKVALAEDETDVSLDADAGELEVIFGDGRHFEPDEETLAEIIRQINERLGRTLTKADRIVFEQMEQDWLEDDQLFAQANANDLENFALAFTKVFEASMLARLGKNDDLVMKILDAPEIKEALEAFYVDRVYHSLREDEKALTTFV
jgi:type I restriction enzyme R subunit